MFHNNKLSCEFEDYGYTDGGCVVKFFGRSRPGLKIGRGTVTFSKDSLHVYCWDPKVKVHIGRYCAIADKVNIIAGGEHDIKSLMVVHYIWDIDKYYDKAYAGAKGDVEIGSDVWIAFNTVILSGVKIGHGAVIGAGSVVVKDIPPYAVAAGNPAKVIRYRYSKSEIEKLLKIKWWNWTEEKIESNLKLFLDIKSFLKKFENDIEDKQPENRDLIPLKLNEMTKLEAATSYSIDEVNGEGHSLNKSYTCKKSSDYEIVVTGWAIEIKSRQRAAGVFINIDNVIDLPAVYGLPRIDVADSLKERNYRYCGFYSTIPATQLSQGTHKLTLKIVSSDRSNYYQTQENIIINIT